MKKILAIVLALALAFAMSTIAFAETTATITDKDNLTDSSSEVKVIVKNGTLPEDPEDIDPDGPDADAIVYKVDIDATGAVFTYTFDADYNTETHQYEGGSWDKPNDVIKVSNHSNTGIDVTAEWKADGVSGVVVDATAKTATLNNVKATLSNTEFKLDSAVNKTAAPSNDIGVAVANIPTVFESEFTLNYVTITIAAAAHN